MSWSSLRTQIKILTSSFGPRSHYLLSFCVILECNSNFRGCRFLFAIFFSSIHRTHNAPLSFLLPNVLSNIFSPPPHITTSIPLCYPIIYSQQLTLPFFLTNSMFSLKALFFLVPDSIIYHLILSGSMRLRRQLSSSFPPVCLNPA